MLPSRAKKILPPQFYVQRSGDWRSQCIDVPPIGLRQRPGSERCCVWKWTPKEISVCAEYSGDAPLHYCPLFKLGPGAPLVDSGKTVRKIAAILAHRETHLPNIAMAHLAVSTTKDLMIKVPSGEEQVVTVVELSSAAGLISVLTVSILIWIISRLAAHIAARRYGYSLRLHTYSGLSAYIVSLEGKYNTAAGRRCIECSVDSAVDAVTGSVRGAETEDESHPCMRLRPGKGQIAEVQYISGSPELPGAKPERGKIWPATGNLGER